MNSGVNSFRERGFSLVEVLTSMTILLIMMAGAAAMLDQTQKTWTTTWTRTSQFRDARLAFELITRNLSQATLNTYWDYEYDSDGKPQAYKRQSELHFYTNQTSTVLPGSEYPGQAVFFQAVLGYSRDQAYRQMDTLLNARGYFVQYTDDSFEKPRFLSTLPNRPQPVMRYRLMEYIPPTESNMVYFIDQKRRDGQGSMDEWFSEDLISLHSRPVVDNVIALIFSPQKSPESKIDRSQIYEMAPQFRYDSRDESRLQTLNLLPPLVKVTLIAIDEPTAIRLAEESGNTQPKLIQPDWFRNAADLDKDLESMKQEFQKDSINYRIFDTTVAIRSAKWSH